MDRPVSLTVIFVCLLMLVVAAGSGIGTALTADSTTESVSTALAVDNESAENDSSNESEATNVTAVDPTFENVTVPIEDAEPFEFGTTVVVQEETLLSLSFQADESDIAGNMSVHESHAGAVDALADNRTVHDTIDITVPANASEVPATLRLVINANPVETRENLEVLRHTDGDWEPLETTVVSNRTWSSDRGASVLLVEADTPGFSTFAVTESNESTTEFESDAEAVNESDAEAVNETELEEDNETAFIPDPGANVYRINDRQPFEAGTYVPINQETVRAITFHSETEGYVAVNDVNSTAVEELREERPVIRTVSISATENASRTAATLHLAVRAIEADSREAVEVMRYDAEEGAWESLETEVTSNRYWSEDHSASVFDIETETPGFSTFAVTQQPEKPDSEPDDTEPEPEEQLPEESADDGGLLFGFGLIQIVVGVVVVLGGLGTVAIVRRR